MSMLIPIIIMMSAVTLAVFVIARRNNGFAGIQAASKKAGSKAGFKTPGPKAVLGGTKTSLKFLWDNKWSVFWLFVAITFFLPLLWEIRSSGDQDTTVSAPTSAFEVSLEHGESSQVFMLNRTGMWRAYLSPCSQILPYVNLVNERTVDGVTYFDGWWIENDSGGTLVFETWQERAREGQAPPECT